MSRRVTRSATRLALASLETNSTTTPSRRLGKKVTLQTPGSRKSVATPCSRLKKKAKLALTPRSAGGTPDDCTICMDKSGTEGGRIMLGCCHHFCRSCLATHAARQARHEQAPSCPLCKGELTEAEVEECGPAREMKEESDDEDDGEQEVLVIMEFEEGEDSGFWIMYDPGEEDEDADSDDDSANDSADEGSADEGSASGAASGIEDDIERAESETRAHGAEAEGSFVLSSVDLGHVKGEGGEEEEGDAVQEDEEDDLEAEEDSRPFGGWRWSASHHAWVGNVSVTRSPPAGPPSEAYDGADPLAGRAIAGVMAVSARLEGAEEEDEELERDGEANRGAAVEGGRAARALTRASRNMTLNADPA